MSDYCHYCFRWHLETFIVVKAQLYELINRHGNNLFSINAQNVNEEKSKFLLKLTLLGVLKEYKFIESV